MSYGYKVFIGDLQLPVTPSKITTTIGSRNEVVDIINGAQINVLREPALTKISFGFLIPHQTYPFAMSPIESAAAFAGSMLAGMAKDYALSKMSENGMIEKVPPAMKAIFTPPSGTSAVGGIGDMLGVGAATAAGYAAQAMGGRDFLKSRPELNTIVKQAIFWYLEDLKLNKKRFSFIVSRTVNGSITTNLLGMLDRLSMRVVLDDYSIEEDAEAYGLDTFVNVNLTQSNQVSSTVVTGDGKVVRIRE